MCQRVDLATGEVVDYVPPRPDDTDDSTFAWSAEAKRWTPSPTAAALERDRKARIVAEIERIESSQQRPLRELALKPGSEGALMVLANTDRLIADLRARLNSGK